MNRSLWTLAQRASQASQVLTILNSVLIALVTLKCPLVSQAPCGVWSSPHLSPALGTVLRYADQVFCCCPSIGVGHSVVAAGLGEPVLSDLVQLAPSLSL